MAQAQPPGGVGGGGFTPPTFDAYNTDKTPGTANAGQQVITAAEVAAYFAGRGAGAAPGGGAPAAGGGAAPAPGGAAPGGGGGGGRGGLDPAATFATWDTNSDGEVTQAEYDARPRRGGGGGRGAPGGGPGGGAAPAPAPAQ